MRRKILMGILAFGVVAGFGSEIRRAAWRGSCGSSCADYEQKGQESLSAATPAVETQASPEQQHKKKGEHCNGSKSRWHWGRPEEKAPATPETPEAPINTAQNQ